jgi:hypothetical protein
VAKYRYKDIVLLGDVLREFLGQKFCLESLHLGGGAHVLAARDPRVASMQSLKAVHIVSDTTAPLRLSASNTATAHGKVPLGETFGRHLGLWTWPRQRFGNGLAVAWLFPQA